MSYNGQYNQKNLLVKYFTLFNEIQVQQHEFRERFRKDAPFRFSSDRPYVLLDRCHEEIMGMENEMAKLYEAAAIFEINVPDFKQMKQCRREVAYIYVSSRTGKDTLRLPEAP